MSAPLAMDQLPALLHRLTRHANEASDIDSVLATAVADVCATLEWPAGTAHLDDVGGPVEGAVVGGTVTAPEELQRRARDTGLPQWEPGAVDAPLTVVVPVLTAAGPVGSLHFSATSMDEVLGQLLGTLGWQLGMVAQRVQDRRELEDREAALERSNEELERFAYVASHDLQEPLRKVVTACELLERRHADQLSQDATRYIEVAVDGAQRMQLLIRDLLAYSRVAREDVRPGTTTELAGIVDEVWRSLSVLHEEEGAVLDVGELPVVSLADDEARQVVTNLLTNAIKYHGDAPPRIRVASEQRDGGMVEVTVCDNGIGIEPEYHERIFEVFRRLHRRDEYSGTGIGLAIVKRIVEHHGGRVWVTDSPSGGTCFHLELPGGDQ